MKHTIEVKKEITEKVEVELPFYGKQKEFGTYDYYKLTEKGKVICVRNGEWVSTSNLSSFKEELEPCTRFEYETALEKAIYFTTSLKFQ